MLSAEKIKKEDSMEVDAQGSASANETTQPKQSNGISNMEQLNRAFSYVTNAILALDKQIREQTEGGEAKMKVDKDDEASSQEDPVLRNIRLNLLALAKRAPFDKLALLPRDLVPEQIRHAIPAQSQYLQQQLQ